MNRQVIIADDEYFIRQKLKKIIPWETLMLSFAGEAENGQEVLALLSDSHCDILLLDIRMPKMDGLKTLEIISSRYPWVRVIIISGYNEFEYAQTAIRYGVTDYLLKPVDSQSLEQSLRNCIGSIDRRENQEMKNKKLLHFERCTLLSNIRNKLAPLQSLYDLDISLKSYTHALYIGTYIMDEASHSMDCFIHMLRSHGCYCEYTKESDYIAVYQLFFQNPADSSRLGSLASGFLAENPCYTFLSIGKIFDLLDDWEPYYKRCIFLLQHRFFTPDSDMVLEHTPMPMQNYSQEIPKIRRNIDLFLNGRNEKELTEYLDELFSSIAFKKCVDFLQLSVMELFLNFRIHDSSEQQAEQNINTYISGILDEEHDLDSLKLTCLSKGLQCIRKNEAIPSDVALSKKIMAYIRQNYTNPELSVAQLAEVLKLNPSYMGSVFKKTNQISVLQFITQTRMESATELLNSGEYKISEIADLIGYSDVFYFSKRFKKSFGYSPKDYAANTKRI